MENPEKRPRLPNGYVQVYTGDGKGKTTAALGLMLRATGSGLRVFIGQFAKGRPCGEMTAAGRLTPPVTWRQFGRPVFVVGAPTEEDFHLAKQGLIECRAALLSGQYDIVILDEVNVATSLKLFSVDELLALIDSKPPHVELILTGRGADPRVVERADLVSEMHEVKHYHAQGVPSRKGIED